MTSARIDATVIGAGPNGLAAAVTLARAGVETVLYERASLVGGGTRSEQLTLPGFVHDVCSAVHPAALASPFFRAWGLTERVPFVIPEVSYAHPLDGGRAGLAYRDLNRTAAALGRDGRAWRGLFESLVERIDRVTKFTGEPLLRVPEDPLIAFAYARRVAEQGFGTWDARFRDAVAPAMFTGVAAHALGAHPRLATAGTGLLLGAHAHAAGWGFPVGGSQKIADALAADFVAHGGRIVLDHEVSSAAELEPSRVTLLDTSTEFLASFAAARLPAGYLRALQRFRHGNGVAKVDFALSAPVPWTNPDVARAPTVHLGGTRHEIADAERQVQRGRVSTSPYVLVTQPSLLDETRSPAGAHTLWAYLHVPRGSELDPTELVTAQVERFAPGFRDVVLASASRNAREVAAANPNDVGGDMQGGAITIDQLIRRPVLSPAPWRTPAPGVYLCSASTPPGPAVHGMNGWFAARAALADWFGVRAESIPLR